MFAPSIESTNHGIMFSGQHNNIFNPRIEIPGDLRLMYKSHDGVIAYNNNIFGYWGNTMEYGKNIIMERGDGTIAESLYDNSIFGIRNFPMILNGDLLFKAPDYRYPKMRYNSIDRTLEFDEAGTTKVKLSVGGNSKHDLGSKEIKNIVIESTSWAECPQNPVNGQVFFDTGRNKPLFYSANLGTWVDSSGTPL